MLDSIRIVLVSPSHPGNIGAVARAMKNMGLAQLYLVSSALETFPDSEAVARACGADDVLNRAVICQNLKQAVADCTFVVATSARDRGLGPALCSPREAAATILKQDALGVVAIVFGCESSGLNNADMSLCQLAVQIPTAPDFQSLNLAAAVQVICYELRQSALFAREKDHPCDQEIEETRRLPELATRQQLEDFCEYLEHYMTMTGFFDPEKPRRLMQRLRLLCNRAQFDQNELNIVRGILATARKDITPPAATNMLSAKEKRHLHPGK